MSGKNVKSKIQEILKMKKKNVYYRLITLLMIFVMFLGVSMILKREKPELSEFEKAAGAVRWIILPDNLCRSLFSVAFPGGKPSEFVSYLFSDMGIAEWPPYEGSGEFSPEELKLMNIPQIPMDIELVPLYPDPETGKQLVVKFDDNRGMVIVEGYMDPDSDPVLVREWILLEVEPAAGIKEIYESSSELGMSDRSF